MPSSYRDPRYANLTKAQRRKRKRRRARIQFFAILLVLLALIVFGISMIVRNLSKDDPVVLRIPSTTVAQTETPAPVTIAPTDAPVPTAAPTAEPTSAPTAAPTAVPTAAPVTSEHDQTYSVLSGVPQTNRALGIQESEAVDFSYFDDAVFVGDSVSLKLYYYVKKVRQDDARYFGSAQFLTAGSLGSGNALQAISDKSVHPSYKGTKMLVEDAIARMKVKKVYIMLGMNDIVIYGTDGAVDNMMKLCHRILQKSPDVEIFIQSATPRLQGDYQKLNNNALFEYDCKLFAACAEKGYHFVDVAYIMRDELGNLPAEYCSDPDAQALHFTDKACRAWIQYLRTHTGTNK